MTNTDRTSSFVYLLLGLTLLAGLTLRTWNVRFDDGMGSHPDERSTACFYAASIEMPKSWEEFIDPQASPLNPLWDRNEGRRRSFTYGHFPLYLGIATGEIREDDLTRAPSSSASRSRSAAAPRDPPARARQGRF